MFTLHFEAPSLPPPHAFAFKLSVDDKLHFEAEYAPLYSHDLKDDEWVDSGLDEELEWKASGTLPTVWLPELQALKQSEVSEAPTTSGYALLVSTHQSILQGFARKDEEVLYSIQELVQAIRELAGMEGVLEIFVKTGKRVQLIQVSFASRTVHWFTDPHTCYLLEWSSLQSFMHWVAQADYELKKPKTSISWDGVQFIGLPDREAEAMQSLLSNSINKG